MRLLCCLECKSIEELHDFDGPPEYDMALETLVERHQSAGIQHIGNLVHVDDKNWAKQDTRDEILAKVKAGLISKPGSGTGLGDEAYELRNTFGDDALVCFGKHLRNPACPDYRSDSKRILPNTNKERRSEGLPLLNINDPRSVRYICDYCPVQSLVDQAKRDAAGISK